MMHWRRGGVALFLSLVGVCVSVGQIAQQWFSDIPIRRFCYPLVNTVDRFGNVFVAGTTYDQVNEADCDWFVYKLNKSGVRLWTRYYNGPGNWIDVPAAIAADHMGNVFVAGRAAGMAGKGTLGVLRKYDTNGGLKFAQLLNGPGNNDAYQGLAIDEAGSAFVTGPHGGSAAKGTDLIGRKVTNTRALGRSRQWSLPGAHTDKGVEIRQSENGSLFVTGEARTSAGSIWILDPTTGVVNRQIPIVDPVLQRGRIVSMDVMNDRVLVCGSMIDGSNNQRGFYEIYSSSGVLFRRKTYLISNAYPYFGHGTLAADGSVSIFLYVLRNYGMQVKDVTLRRYGPTGSLLGSFLLKSGDMHGTMALTSGVANRVFGAAYVRYTGLSGGVNDIFVRTSSERFTIPTKITNPKYFPFLAPIASSATDLGFLKH